MVIGAQLGVTGHKLLNTEAGCDWTNREGGDRIEEKLLIEIKKMCVFGCSLSGIKVYSC